VVGERPVTFEAEYRAGIGAGRAVVRRSGSMLWVLDPSATLAATLSVAPGTH